MMGARLAWRQLCDGAAGGQRRQKLISENPEHGFQLVCSQKGERLGHKAGEHEEVESTKGQSPSGW